MSDFDLAVIGGGVIGLACAFEETLRGKRVAILDPNPIGQKASWAAAGILAARAGVVGSSPLREFYLRSLYTYPGWLARIESESGIRVPFERSGDYQIFRLNDVDSVRALKARERQLIREKALRFSVADELPGFLRKHSSLKNVRVFHFPDDAYVHNRILLEALQTVLEKHGAKTFQVKPLSISRNGNESILTGHDWKISTRQILIAAGAWSNDVLKLLGLSIPLSPVKGQLATLPNFHGQNSMIHAQERFYLIPRGDQLLAGATTEADVWDEGFNASGDSYLRNGIETFFPRANISWSQTWSGLRPGSADRLPLMGWVDEKSGIALCTGHYKSGISLAPMTARCMSALLNGEKPPAKLKAFSPLRPEGLKHASL